MPSREILGKRLKIFRESLADKPTREAFADKAGIDPSQYSKAERGVKWLGDDKVEELCSKWDVSHDWLYTGKGIMKESEAKAAVDKANSARLAEAHFLTLEDVVEGLRVLHSAAKRIVENNLAEQREKEDKARKKVRTDKSADRNTSRTQN